MSLPVGWSRIEGAEQYALERDDGFWRISRASIRGEWRYTLWHSAPGRSWVGIESFDSAADAAEHAVKLEEGYDPREAK